MTREAEKLPASGPKIVISRFGPVCPSCRCDGFDDWHHEPGLKFQGGIVGLTGRIKCHDCGKFFKVTAYLDGETHSTMGLGKRAAILRAQGATHGT